VIAIPPKLLNDADIVAQRHVGLFQMYSKESKNKAIPFYF